MRCLLWATICVVFPLTVEAATIEPCAAEKMRVESTHDAIAESTTRTLEIRSELLSDQEQNRKRLLANLEQAEDRFRLSNQTLLQESALLQTLLRARTRLDRLEAAAPRLAAFQHLPLRPSTAVALAEVLRMQRSSLDSEAVSDMQILIETVRMLEGSSRNWRTQVGQEMPESLTTVLEFVFLQQDRLNESVMNGPKYLAGHKLKVTEAQNALAEATVARRFKEQELNELERRLNLLRQNLSPQKAALRSCTHRAQFGE